MAEKEPVIDEKKLAEMKAFAEHCDEDVLGVTIPKEQMAEIADTALKLWRVARAAEEMKSGSGDCDAINCTCAKDRLYEALAALEEGK